MCGAIPAQYFAQMKQRLQSAIECTYSRLTYIYTAKPLVPESSSFENEILTEHLKRYALTTRY